VRPRRADDVPAAVQVQQHAVDAGAVGRLEGEGGTPAQRSLGHPNLIGHRTGDDLDELRPRLGDGR